MTDFWDIVDHDAQVAGLVVSPHVSIFVRLFQLRSALRQRPGFACVFWLRVNQYFIKRTWRGHFRIRVWRQYRFANDISPYAKIGPGLLLPHIADVTVGSSAVIGKNVTLYNGVTIEGTTTPNRPLLGDNVTVYTGAKVIGPLQIGDNSVIGALAFCKHDVPANSVMYGIPPNVTVKPKKEEPSPQQSGEGR